MIYIFRWVEAAHQWYVFDEKGKHRFELFDCEWLEQQIPQLDKTQRNHVEIKYEFKHYAPGIRE